MSPRAQISPFKRGLTWWARIPRIGGRAVQRSLGVESKQQADLICIYLGWLRERREAWLLDELAAGRVRVGDAYTAYLERRHDEFIRECRDGIADLNLEPLIADWMRELTRRGRPAAITRAAYERQVRTLIGPPGAVFRQSQLTRKRIREWLGALDVTAPNRFRAALSAFCEFLVFEEVLAMNPVLQIRAARDPEPRRRHLSVDEAEALVAAIAHPAAQACHALMLATGIERGVALKLRHRDIERGGDDDVLAAVYAAGTKRAHRNRTCMVYSRWAGLWRVVEAYLRAHPGLPDGKVWGALTEYQLHSELGKALVARGIEDYRTHDHRHTWAVQGIRDGLAIHTISHQLGHRDAVMALRVYGVFIPQRSDFRTRSATTNATSPVQGVR